jgi:hypothetical protein
MSVPATWRGVVKAYKAFPREIRAYFNHVPKLAKDYPWDVCLAYEFSRVELGQNMAIYCAVVKLHRADPALARRAVENHPMFRDQYRQLFATVFGKPLDKPVIDALEEAEAVRDKIMHGKTVTERRKRKAVIDVLEYARLFNAQVDQVAGFKPYGDLRGFKGRAKALPKSTTRWVLKGLGLSID